LLDDLGLAAAIEWQANSFQEYAGIQCVLDLPETHPDLSPELATGVFRIFQEALTNVARHSQATEVHVKLSIDKNELMLEVRDNGRGITGDEINRYASLGLLGMKERVRTWNGEIEFVGEQGVGTTVVVRIPLG
jgi:signal transduction histidine kinase